MFEKIGITLALLFFINPVLSAEWKDLDFASAEISFVGDDSFVTKRRYSYSSGAETEQLLFRGGYLFWQKLMTDWSYNTGFDVKHHLLTIFNSNKHMSKFLPLNISKNDVQKSEDGREGYFWASQQKNNVSCMMVVGIWGIGGSNGPGGGDNKIQGSACRAGNKENLEAFMHDIMKRVRIDGGAINKMKASRKYKALKKQVIIKREVTKETKSKPTYTPYEPKTKTNSSTSNDLKERLTKLKELEDAGLITKEEAVEKRKAILDSL